MKITEARLNQVMTELHEMGYSYLDGDEKAICDAFDAGTLVISDNQPHLSHGEPNGAHIPSWMH